MSSRKKQERTRCHRLEGTDVMCCWRCSDSGMSTVSVGKHSAQKRGHSATLLVFGVTHKHVQGFPRVQGRVAVVNCRWNRCKGTERPLSFWKRSFLLKRWARRKGRLHEGWAVWVLPGTHFLPQQRWQEGTWAILKPLWVEKELVTGTAMVFSQCSSLWPLEVSMWVSQANMASLRRLFFINFNVSECSFIRVHELAVFVWIATDTGLYLCTFLSLLPQGQTERAAVLVPKGCWLPVYHPGAGLLLSHSAQRGTMSPRKIPGTGNLKTRSRWQENSLCNGFWDSSSAQ